MENMEHNDLHQPLNLKLLAKREKTERMVVLEHHNTKLKLKQKQEIHKIEVLKLELLKEESNLLNHKSAILSAEIARMKINISKIQHSVEGTMCKIDEIKPKQMMARIVQEKEERTMNLVNKETEARQEVYIEFWKRKMTELELSELEEQKAKLIERQHALEDQINRFKENCPESKIAKLTEECLILRKRNAAYMKRKSKILEQLEMKLTEKQNQLTHAQSNTTFKFS